MIFRFCWLQPFRVQYPAELSSGALVWGNQSLRAANAILTTSISEKITVFSFSQRMEKFRGSSLKCLQGAQILRLDNWQKSFLHSSGIRMLLPGKSDMAESRWQGVGETRGEEQVTCQEQSPCSVGRSQTVGAKYSETASESHRLLLQMKLCPSKNSHAEAPASERDRIWRRSIKR